MDAVFFSVKRAHHAGLKFCRPMLAAVGLTPARFDLLFALAQGRVDKTQSALRMALGVARSTISEMLAELERIGLVARERSAPDKRTRTVNLTEKGLAAVNEANDAFVNDGFVPLHVNGVLTGHDAEVDDYGPRVELDLLCTALRRGFGDFAIYELYSWDLEEISDDLTEIDDPFGHFERPRVDESCAPVIC